MKSGRNLVPYVRVRVSDLIAGVRRLRMTSLYSGVETDQPHGGATCSNGTVIRARRTSGTTLQYQAIASPSSGSSWSSWTSLATLGSGTYAQAAADGAQAIIVVDDGNNVVEISSTNSGSSWAAKVTARAGGATCAPVACGIKSDGTAAAFWVESGVLYGARRSAGVWAARVASGLAFTSISGLGACWDGADWFVVITGVASSQARVWTARFGEGGAVTVNTWETARVVVAEDTTSTIAFKAPNCSNVDTRRISYVEVFTGTGAYTANYWTWKPLLGSYEDLIWKEPVLLPTTYSNGIALSGSATKFYFTAPAYVREATLPDTAGTDYSSSVVAAEWSEPGRCRVVLNNSSGALTSTFLRGSELQIVPGYVLSGTNTVPSSGPYPTYWIDRVRVVEEGGRGLVILEGGDVWSLLDGWVARRQVQFSGTAVGTLLATIAAWAGVGYSPASSSAELVALSPSVTLPAGESAAAAIRRLFRLVSDRPYQNGALLQSDVFSSSASSSWGFGGTSEQPFVRYERSDEVIRPAYVRVVGSTFGVGQARDDAMIALIADPGRVLSDRAISGATDLSNEATRLLRDAQLEAYGDELEGWVNPGMTHLDVVAITGARLGLSSSKRRVLSLTNTYDRTKKLTYKQVLKLGAP